MAEYIIGTSGFSYTDWREYFYPKDLKKSDFLRYYSRHFRTTEVNSTYYLMPSLQTVESMVRKTPDDFIFSVKANQIFTHKRFYTRSDVEKMKEIALAFGKKLGVLLFQFPYSFHRNQENEDYVKKLRGDFLDFEVAFEFRSYEWFSQSVYRLLEKLDCALVCVDEPRIRGLPPSVFVATIKRFAYIRFHGRNAEKWYEHKLPSERYDYMYSREELEEWADKIKSSQVDRFYIYFNNHPRAQAVQNAKMMERLIT